MRTVVVVPTYQEAANIVRFLTAVRKAVPEADVLVVDDNSPDGTADLASTVGASLGQVTVVVRPKKDGLGSAYRHAFGLVALSGYDVVVQMDSDFSHEPAAIGTLIAGVEAGADCVIGSRYVPGGSTPNWPAHRRLLSRYGNRYTAAVLELPIRDATSGFRAYRGAALERIEVDTTRSSGYAFMSEIAHRLVDADLRVDEVPITFRDRTHGTSKMSARIIVESMARVTWAGLRSRSGRGRR